MRIFTTPKMAKDADFLHAKQIFAKKSALDLTQCSQRETLL